jgi:hypothetical protein
MPRSFPILALLTLLSLATAADAQQWTAEKIIGELNKKRSRPRIVMLSIVEKILTQDIENPKVVNESTEASNVTFDFPNERYRFETKRSNDGLNEHRIKVYDGKEIKGMHWKTDKNNIIVNPEKTTAGIGMGQFHHATFELSEYPFVLMFGSILPESTLYYPGNLFFPLNDKHFNLDRVDAIKGRQIIALRSIPTGTDESRIFNEYLIDPSADFGVIKMTQYRSRKSDTKKQTIYDISIELQKSGLAYLPKSWTIRSFSGSGMESLRRVCTVVNIDSNVSDAPDLFDIQFAENQKVVRRLYGEQKSFGTANIVSKEQLVMIDGKLVPNTYTLIWRWVVAAIAVMIAIGVTVFFRRRRLRNKNLIGS